MKGKKLSKEELKKFENILLEQRQYLIGEKDKLEREALEPSGNITTIPTHMADISADNFEQDLTLSLIENEEEVVREIDQALERINKNTYGICENCETIIRKERLVHIPHAGLCIECQREEESKNQIY